MVNRAVIIAAGKGSRLNGNGANLPKPLVKVAGVGLLKRAILSAKRAGIKEFAVVIGYRGEEIRRALACDPQIDVRIDWVENPDWERGNGVSVLKARDGVDEPFLLMMSDHVFDPLVLLRLRSLPVAPDEAVLCVDPRLDGIFDMEDATKVRLEGDRICEIGKGLASFDAVDTGFFLCNSSLFGALERSISEGDESLSGGIRRLAAQGHMRAVDIGDLFWQDVDTPGSLKYAEAALFRMLGKPTDGFVSRHLNRKVSTRISRLLVKTPVTPNQISVATMLMSFLAAWWTASGDYLHLALGGLLFQFASIADGCDGEVAKLKFMGSRLGEWVDTLADSVSYVAFFASVAFGMYRRSGEPYVLALGAGSVGLVLLSLSLIYLYLQIRGSGSVVSFNMAFSNEVPEDKRGWFHRFASSLKFATRRDFFAALFCGLALLNRLDAVYWIMTIGTALVATAIFLFAGHMMRSRGAWTAVSAGRVQAGKLFSEKAD